MKTVFISGASGEIGLEISRVFLDMGMNAVLLYNSGKDRIETLLSEYPDYDNVIPLRADLKDTGQMHAAVKAAKDRFSSVDILINAAGISSIGFFDATGDEQWDEILNINLKSAYLFSREFSKDMIRKRFGRIINISSIWGSRGASMEVMYSVTKAGMDALTRSLARELGPSGITVNSVAPGVIDTKMNSHLDSDEIEDLIEDTPVMRLGTPADVASAVRFLSGEDASFITGQVITVDGGFTV